MKLPLPDFLTPFRAATATYDQHGKLIAEKKKQRAAGENLMADKAEHKEEASRQIQAYAAVHRERINIEMPNPSDILFIPSGSPHAPLFMTPHDLLCFMCWSNGAAMEANFHAQIDEMMKGKKTITKAERARQLQKLDEEIRQLETEREAMAVELEKTGLQVARDENLDPEVFLEFESPSKWNRAKLVALRSSISANYSRNVEINQEIQSASAQQHEWRSLVGRASTTTDRERFQRNLDEIEAKKKELLTRRDGIDNANRPRQKLFNRCLEFLKTHGVEFESTNVVRLAS